MKTLSFALLCASVALVFSVAVGDEPKPGAAPVAAPGKKGAESHSADEAAIRQSAAAFREAFNRGDAKAVAALWTTDGDYIDEDGQRFQGRAAIEQEYARFFAAQPGVKIAVVVDSVRVLGGETAIEDGRSTLEPAPEGAPAMSRYTAVHIKANGKWLISNVRDSRVEIPSSYGHLQDLEPLIGSWVADEHDAKMEVVCRWLANKNFIERKYSVQESGRETSSGLQVIGWDPLQQRVQSWTFTSDGGYAIGVWSPREKGWAVVSKGVMADGTISTSVNLMTLIDRDGLTWQSVERAAGGVRLPDLEEVLLKRVLVKP
jgi:uncharacterized protein (TIGR02246 family)